MSQGDMWQRFTAGAGRVLQFAQEEARKLGGNIIGTEHLLLGLVREGDGVAARVARGPRRRPVVRTADVQPQG